MSSIETYVRNESRPEFAGQSLRLKPLLATPWGRALIAGIFVGMIPLVTVTWVFFDKQFINQFSKEELEQWVFLRSLGLLGDALPWICLSAVILLIGIFGKRRDIATWAVFLCISIATGGAVVNLVKFIFRLNPAMIDFILGISVSLLKNVSLSIASTISWLKSLNEVSFLFL